MIRVEAGKKYEQLLYKIVNKCKKTIINYLIHKQKKS